MKTDLTLSRSPDPPRRQSRFAGTWRSLTNSPQIWPHLLLLPALILSSLWSLIAYRGIVLFQNWSWPIGGSPYQVLGVYNPGIWSLSGPDVAGFTRSATDWPVFLTANAIGLPSFLTERLVIVYSFVGAYILGYLAATLLLRFAFPHLGSSRREGLRIVFILLMFVNPAALQWEAGILIPFLWGVPLLIIAVLCWLFAFRLASYKYAAFSGLALGLGATLDPRLAIWGFAAVGLIGLGQILFNSGRVRTILRGIAAAAAALPGLGLTLYAYSWAGVGTSPVHPASLAAMAAVSGNATPLNVMELLGYYISGIAYAPPVLALGQQNLGALQPLGSPPYGLVDSQFLSALWLLSLVAIPLVAWSSFLYRRYRTVSLPFGIVALLAMTSAASVQLRYSPVPTAETFLGQFLPGTLGAVLQTTFAVPIYVQVLSEAMILPLVIVGIAGLLEVIDGLGSTRPFDRTIRIGQLAIQIRHPRRFTPRKVRYAASIATVVIVACVVFGSWQFFSGSFYPGGLSPGVQNNGASTTGALQPTIVPSADRSIFAYLQSKPPTFEVYWPGPDTYSYPWNPKWSPGVAMNPPLPTTDVPGMAYAIANNLTGDVATLLRDYGVTYVVLDNMSAGALENQFGVPTINQVVSFFERCANLSLELSFPPNAWLFQVDPVTPGVLSFSSQLLRTGVPLDQLSPIAGALSDIGISPAFAPVTDSSAAWVTSVQGALSNSSAGVTVANPSWLDRNTPQDSISGLNSTGGNATTALDFTNPGEARLLPPDNNWTVSVWQLSAQNLTVVEHGVGPLSFNAPSRVPSQISLNYLSSLVSGSRDGIQLAPGGLTTVSVSATAQALTSNSSGTFDLNVVLSNTSAENIAQYSSQAAPLTTKPSTLNFTTSLPGAGAYFTLRVFSTFAGSVALSNVSIRWTQFLSNGQAFDGIVAPYSNASLSIPAGPLGTPTERLFVCLAGNTSATLLFNGTQESQTVFSFVPKWVEFTIPAIGTKSATLQLSGQGRFAGLILDRLPTPTNATSSFSFDAVSSTVYTGTFSSSASGYLLLHLPYVDQWSLAATKLHAGGPMESLLGQVMFFVPPGKSSLSINLRGVDAGPVLLALFDAYYVGALIGVVWIRKRHRSAASHDSSSRVNKM